MRAEGSTHPWNGEADRTAAPSNRWLIAAFGVLMQVALGAVYAWSVFRIPLTRAYGWTVSEVTIAFELAILVLGFAAFFGGLWMRRSGPRPVALLAAVLYGLGTILAGQAHSLTGLYLSYGVIGGAGLGLGYIVPVATLIRWFPDKRGMITGIAVAGFGAGALVTAPIAEMLIASAGLPMTFATLGISYFLIILLAAVFMTNPPVGYGPGGVSQSSAPTLIAQDLTLSEAVKTWQWYGLWLVLFLNTVAGIALISQASPMAQEISHVSPVTAAGLVGIISIANGAGRFLWAWFSDVVGRRGIFLTMFLVQSAAFIVLSNVTSFGWLAFLSFIIILSYGGGFGTMPAFAADYFGSKDIGSIYGIMLTAWGVAGVVGPSAMAQVREATGQYQGALRIMALITLVSTILPLLLHPPAPLRSTEARRIPETANR